MPKKFEPEFYPSPTNNLWNIEILHIVGHLQGLGADVGCGPRSIYKTDIRIDIDKKWNPDLLCSGDKLEMKNNQLDYIYCSHVLEHFKKPVLALHEWLRVVKDGGIVAMIIPDIRFTKNAKSNSPKMAASNPMKHYADFRLDTFETWLKETGLKNFFVVDSGQALPNFSFYFVLQKIT
jgi:predicted SAM-dependent methyltransferase